MDKYSRRNMMNLQQQLQRHYLKNKRFFSAIFIAFIKPTLNLEHFDKKNVSLIVFSISQIIDSEGGGYLNVQKRLASEDLSAINVFRSSKHCRNQHDITIILLFHEY